MLVKGFRNKVPRARHVSSARSYSVVYTPARFRRYPVNTRSRVSHRFYSSKNDDVRNPYYGNPNEEAIIAGFKNLGLNEKEMQEIDENLDKLMQIPEARQLFEKLINKDEVLQEIKQTKKGEKGAPKLELPPEFKPGQKLMEQLNKYPIPDPSFLNPLIELGGPEAKKLSIKQMIKFGKMLKIKNELTKLQSTFKELLDQIPDVPEDKEIPEEAKPEVERLRLSKEIAKKSLESLPPPPEEVLDAERQYIEYKKKKKLKQKKKLARFSEWTKLPMRFWEKALNRRKYLEFVASSLSETATPTPNDLYKITHESVVETGGGGLLLQYGGSPALAVMVEYPEHAWKMWNFQKSPKAYWKELGQLFAFNSPIAKEAVRVFVEDVEKKLGLKSYLEWNESVLMRLSKTDIKRLAYLGGAPSVLETLYPDLDIEVDSRLRQVLNSKVKTLINAVGNAPTNWKSRVLREQYLDSLKEMLGGDYHHMYEVNRLMFYCTGGSKLLEMYDSVPSVIIDTYPEYPWKRWKFVNCKSKKWWANLRYGLARNNPEALKTATAYITDLEKEHKITSPEGWYDMTWEVLGHAVRRQMNYLGGLLAVLQKVYPNVEWKASRFHTYAKKSTQRSLSKTMQDAFPAGVGTI